MRNSGLVVIGLLVVCFATTGVNECYPTKQVTTCNGALCQVVIRLNNQCEPVDVAGRSLRSVRVNPGTSVCFFNDTTCTFRLTFPPVLFGSRNVERTIKAGACAQLVIANKAARKTVSYQIACDCPEAGGGHGNPEFKVGGGSGGGGGGGGEGGGG